MTPKATTGTAREEIVRVLRKHGFDAQADCADVTGTIGADLISALLAARRAALDEAAKVCEEAEDAYASCQMLAAGAAVQAAAFRIRALAASPCAGDETQEE